LVKSSIGKSWGPLWGSDLLIDDDTQKHALQGWMVSRSEAINLTDAVALGERAKRPLQGRGQGEAKPPIARPDVRH
jgi:hypothetical protein